MSNEASALAADQVDHNTTALQGSKMEALVGSRSTLDILNADQELLQSRITAVAQNCAMEIASYQVLATIGQLTAKHLGLAVKQYDPNQHYQNSATKWLGVGGE